MGRAALMFEATLFVLASATPVSPRVQLIAELWGGASTSVNVVKEHGVGTCILVVIYKRAVAVRHDFRMIAACRAQYSCNQ